MISADAFLAALDDHGRGPYLGVPCSFLTPLINHAIASAQHRYLPANNEGEAVAIAAGAFLAGAKPVVMFQNSGLGNAVSPLTSLTHTFRIPLLLVTTRRGQPGLRDEPQHALMGRITEPLLRTMGVPCAVFPDSEAQLAPRVRAAEAWMEAAALPYAFIMPKGSVADSGAAPPPGPVQPPAGRVVPGAGRSEPPLLSRRDAIAALAAAGSARTAVIAGTGRIGRELFACAEGPRNFYVVGSMGCAGSIGLGVALQQPQRPVMVLDGDGAALMRLEACVSIGHYAPPGMVHAVLDNGMHESTGGQASLAGSVDLPAVAVACGYATAERVVTEAALGSALRRAQSTPGPHLLHVRVRPGSEPGLGRPTLTPEQVKQRFMAFLAE